MKKWNISQNKDIENEEHQSKMKGIMKKAISEEKSEKFNKCKYHICIGWSGCDNEGNKTMKRILFGNQWRGTCKHSIAKKEKY